MQGGARRRARWRRNPARGVGRSGEAALRLLQDPAGRKSRYPGKRGAEDRRSRSRRQRKDKALWREGEGRGKGRQRKPPTRTRAPDRWRRRPTSREPAAKAGDKAEGTTAASRRSALAAGGPVLHRIGCGEPEGALAFAGRRTCSRNARQGRALPRAPGPTTTRSDELNPHQERPRAAARRRGHQVLASGRRERRRVQSNHDGTGASVRQTQEQGMSNERNFSPGCIGAARRRGCCWPRAAFATGAWGRHRSSKGTTRSLER